MTRTHTHLCRCKQRSLYTWVKRTSQSRGLTDFISAEHVLPGRAAAYLAMQPHIGAGLAHL